VEVTRQQQVEKSYEGKKIYRIMVKGRHKFGSHHFLFKVIELSIFICWREKVNEEREEEYSREETSARIIALRGMDKQILSNRWKDLHWTDDRIATFTEKERKKMKVNREVDHTTGEKRLGEERRLRENPPHVLYFLYEKEDEINFSEAQEMTTYI